MAQSHDLLFEFIEIWVIQVVAFRQKQLKKTLKNLRKFGKGFVAKQKRRKERSYVLRLAVAVEEEEVFPSKSWSMRSSMSSG